MPTCINSELFSGSVTLCPPTSLFAALVMRLLRGCLLWLPLQRCTVDTIGHKNEKAGWFESDHLFHIKYPQNNLEFDGTCELQTLLQPWTEKVLLVFFHKKPELSVRRLKYRRRSGDITSFFSWTHQRPHGRDPPVHLAPPGCRPTTRAPCQQVRQNLISVQTWSSSGSAACELIQVATLGQSNHLGTLNTHTSCG